MSNNKTYDIFVSHASEDKDSFVRSLVKSLERVGLEVWYDEFTLRPGMSLSGEIDRGLADCKYGVVVLSPSFFAKNWPKHELAGLRARQMNGQNVIIPIWHGVTHGQVLEFSPPLADMLAFSSALGTDEIVEQILSIANPGTNAPWISTSVREIATGLDSVEPMGSGYDYWPNGGLRNLYNRVTRFISYSMFQKKYGGRIWRSGPHSEAALDLNSCTNFGHYDPNFVSWLYENTFSLLQRPALVALLKPIFDGSLSKLCALYHCSYEFLRLNPAVAESLRKRFVDMIESGSLQPGQFYELAWATSSGDEHAVGEMMRRLDELFDSNRAASSVYFWIRRIEDGTAPLFAKIAQLLHHTFPDDLNLDRSVWDLEGRSAEFGGSYADWRKMNELLLQHMGRLFPAKPNVKVQFDLGPMSGDKT